MLLNKDLWKTSHYFIDLREVGQFYVFQNVSLGFSLKHPLETGLAPTVHPHMERRGVNYLDSNEPSFFFSFFFFRDHKTAWSIPSFHSSTTRPICVTHIHKDEFTIPAPIPCTDHPRVAVYIWVGLTELCSSDKPFYKQLISPCFCMD